MGKLTLSKQQDGTGYFYGQYVGEGDLFANINVIPPKTWPKPSFVMSLPEEQHETLWIVYADGEEIARCETRDAIQKLDFQRLVVRS